MIIISALIHFKIRIPMEINFKALLTCYVRLLELGRWRRASVERVGFCVGTKTKGEIFVSYATH